MVENFLVRSLHDMILGCTFASERCGGDVGVCPLLSNPNCKLKTFLKRMSISKMQGMLGILEEELRALIEVVVEVDPQAAETFNKNLREQVQKLRKVDQKMMDAMNANNAKLNALLKEKEALLAEKEVTLDRTKAMLAVLKAELDEREARIARREAELGISGISILTGMAQA